jgi:hypothetical protein
MKVSQKNKREGGVIINNGRGDEILRSVEGSDEDDYAERKFNDSGDGDE